MRTSVAADRNQRHALGWSDKGVVGRAGFKSESKREGQVNQIRWETNREKVKRKSLVQKSGNLEHCRRSADDTGETKLIVFKTAWKKSLFSYRKDLRVARSTSFCILIDDNKNNPRFLYNILAKLSRNKTMPGTFRPAYYNINDFMNYLNAKILNNSITVSDQWL